jgi:predicted peroxiredoxin
MSMEMAILFTVDPKEDLERASMGLSIANAALATDTKVKIFFSLGGIKCLVKGYVDDLKAEHFASFKELLDFFHEEGGVLHACSPFMAARGIKAEDLIDGVIISSAPTLVHDADNGILTI